MKKRKRWVKYVAVILTVLYALGTKGTTVKAASADQYANLAGVFDSNGEVIFASSAVALEVDGTKMIFTSQYSGSTDGIQPVIVTAQDNQYGLVYADDVEYVSGYSISVWVLDESAADYRTALNEILFLQLDDPLQNENAVAVFVDVESLEVKTLSMTLRECDSAGLLTADAYPSGALYPAALIGEDGDLVGLCFDDGVAWAVYGGAEFYGDASSSQDPNVAPPLPEREERQTNPTPTPEEPASNPSSGGSSTPDPTPAPAPTPSSFQTNLLLAIGVALVIVVSFVIGMAVKNKKTKQTSGTAPTPAPAPTPTIPSTPRAEDTGRTMPTSYIEDSGPAPFTPAPSPSGGQPEYWLAARGGIMNGRVYPVETGGVTIGRDASSVIRYPADTPGVSRVHAKLYWQGSQLVLMDCNSSSGTFLKRQGKLAPMVPVVLQNGDVFYIGEKANGFEVRN